MTATQYTKVELESQTVAELKAIADSENISVPSHATKDEIIKAILKGQNSGGGGGNPAAASNDAPATQAGVSQQAFSPNTPPSLDNPLAAGSDMYGNGREFKITPALLALVPASPNNFIILGGLPLGTIAQLARIWINTPVAGTPTPTCTAAIVSLDMSVSPPTVIHTYLAAFDVVGGAAGAHSEAQLTTGNVEPTDRPVALGLQIVGTNLGTLTAGSFSAFARYVALAPAPPLRYDTTAQTPRVMPPY